MSLYKQFNLYKVKYNNILNKINKIPVLHILTNNNKLGLITCNWA